VQITEQQEAFDRIQERSPELAKAYSEVAENIQTDPNYDPTNSFNAMPISETTPASSFSAFKMQ